MSFFRRLLRWTLVGVVVLGLLGAAVGATIHARISSGLPDVQTLRSTELQEPLQVYAKDGRLIALFGEGRRYPIDIESVPKPVKDAFLAAEDADFYKHEGIDFKGIARAVWLMATTSDRRIPGGSTITMQVAKMFYQEGQKRDYDAKLAQMLLARKIEQEMSKDEIFELYLNKSFFGHRSYGIAAAAEYYYGKTLDQLTLGEIATLVATPKFPSSANPLTNPARNRERRNDYILPRMVQLGMIGQAEADAAAAEPMHAAPHERPVEVYAPYVAEMVRQEMIARYGEAALTRGYHVTTTIDPALQAAADGAVIAGLRIYDRRHGFNKVERRFDLAPGETDAAIAARLAAIPPQAGSVPAVVVETGGDGSATVIDREGQRIVLPAAAGRPWPGKSPSQLYKRGDLARIRKPGKDGEWKVDQLPRAQATLVSLDPDNGALVALVGGYSFAGNKFNRATQARRQPGSSFKPFIYAASLERGFNPASIVQDAPVVFRQGNGKVWRPQNDGGRFAGPVRLREALVWSRNLVSVRLLDAIGVDYARRYISHFGFDEKEMPPNLSMSLGTASLTPLSVARGYAVFANGGSRVNTWFIDEVKDRDGKIVFKENPPTACRGCGGHAAGSGDGNTPARPEVVDGFNFGAAAPAKPAAVASQAAKPTALPEGGVIAPRAIDARVAYQIQSMMADVVKRGTATAARVLKREDIGGKTGSTNDHRDAWFTGYGGPYVTVVWVGRDDFKSLGYREYGGKAALPIWISYMKAALEGQPVRPLAPPEGMVKVSVSAGGQLIPGGAGGIVEWIKAEDLEKLETQVDHDAPDDSLAEPAEDTYDIF
ncbi:PBP1A family penicillin-binding protein [Lysobacter pythonis]|uniref:Penicillin-binding protein 1A n=1 Tax=Solilutibacter pythonis TaxID=2483112 RepID=A0A3M2HUA9_9GAMM|nr:PBP1A family penicillin-binding protein [Lysobacter pythonis]RMH93291.1 PBP1A family penicillin-binding protein [Lysobacter pythonis]